MVAVEEGCHEGARIEKGREEGEVDEDGEERKIRVQIVQEVVAGIKEKVSVREGEKDDVKGPVEQSFHAKLGLLTG